MPIEVLQYGVKVRDPTTKQFSDLAALRGADGAAGPGVPTGGTDGDVLVKNGATDYAAKWTNTPKLMGSLAYINTGSTADREYQPGEYLVYNGQLYKVGSTAISQGQTLTPGGNITATDVTSNLISSAYDTNSLSVCDNAGITITMQHHYRIGLLHTYRFAFTVGSSAIPAFTEFLDGFASHYGGWVNGQPVFYGWNNGSRQVKLFISSNDTRISCVEQLPAGTNWRASFTIF